MSDNILSAVLTFSLLAGGAAAIGSEMFHTPPAKAPVVVMPQVTITAQRAATPKVMTMPMVTITAKRAAAEACEIVTLPTVVVTGRREAVTVAADSHGDDTSRVQ